MLTDPVTQGKRYDLDGSGSIILKMCIVYLFYPHNSIFKILYVNFFTYLKLLLLECLSWFKISLFHYVRVQQSSLLRFFLDFIGGVSMQPRATRSPDDVSWSRRPVRTSVRPIANSYWVTWPLVFCLPFCCFTKTTFSVGKVQTTS